MFPKLLKLAQNHLSKVKSLKAGQQGNPKQDQVNWIRGPVYYNSLIGEIIDSLAGEFPETLLLVDQGRFIIGYYQQYQSFFEKKNKDIEEKTEEN